jgi:hypothetical protein
MKKPLLLVLSIVALISALLIGATAAATATTDPVTTSQFWYLNETGGPDLGSLQMLRGNDATTGSYTIPAGGSKTWIADEYALDDVTFPDGSWITTVSTDKNWAVKTTDKPKISVKIGSYNVASDKYSYFSTFTAGNGYQKAIKYIIEAEGMLGSQSVVKGDYLVLTITNNDSAAHPIYFEDGASNLMSPDSDPGYPLPEIAAGILLGGGLVGLVGFVAIRRKKVHAAV